MLIPIAMIVVLLIAIAIFASFKAKKKVDEVRDEP